MIKVFIGTKAKPIKTAAGAAHDRDKASSFYLWPELTIGHDGFMAPLSWSDTADKTDRICQRPAPEVNCCVLWRRRA